MLAALDVQYDERAQIAASGAVIFERWDSASPAAEYVALTNNIQPYEPGEFFKRELPCLLAVLDKVQETLEQIVIDGYVMLGERPGLGWRLWDALQQRVPVVGVAKSKFHSAGAVEVRRGRSQSPLLITAIGITAEAAAQNVAEMAGDFRLPGLLKRADQLARESLAKHRSG